MNVLITGGTGLIGKRLTELLLQEGYQVIYLSRSRKKFTGSIPTYHWNIGEGQIDDEAIRNADHIVHLAGASIAGGRWTAKRKEDMYLSRIGSTKLLLRQLKNAKHHVKTFISASAVGYYGDGKDKWLTEEAPAGNDFLAKLCSDWEAETQKVNSLGIRTVIYRIGIVLSRNGGALPELARSMNFGVATYLGSGNQYLSWIHIDDLCRAFLFAIKNNQMNGVYNAVAPSPVTNREMTDAIRRAKKIPAIVLPAPAFALKLALGEMSQALLTGQRCSSEKLLKAGFKFSYPRLDKALSAEFR